MTPLRRLRLLVVWVLIVIAAFAVAFSLIDAAGPLTSAGTGTLVGGILVSRLITHWRRGPASAPRP